MRTWKLLDVIVIKNYIFENVDINYSIRTVAGAKCIFYINNKNALTTLNEKQF